MQWELTLLFLATKRKEEDRNNPNLASARGKWPYMFEIWWLMGVCRMFGGRLKGVCRVSGGLLWDDQRVYGVSRCI